LLKATAEFAPSLVDQYFKGKFLIGCLGILVRLFESFYRIALSQEGY
jgi:hypothetical protein